MARPLKARGAIQIQRARPAAELQKIQILYNCFQKGLTRADIHPSGVLAVLTDVDPSVSVFRLNHRKHRNRITFHFEFLLLK